MNDKWRRTPDTTAEADLEAVDGFTELATDHIPTMDQEDPAASYADWNKDNTKVITVRIANDLYRDTLRFETRQEALAAITLTHGKVVEANYVPGRAFFRVYRTRPAHGSS